jgi:hypothetical protein
MCKPHAIVFGLTLRATFSASVLAWMAARSMERWPGCIELATADFAASVARALSSARGRRHDA